MSHHDRSKYYTGINIDKDIKLPNYRKRHRPTNFTNSLHIDPDMPLPVGPKSGRITDPSMFRHRDLSYKQWNPDLGEYDHPSKYSKYGIIFSAYGEEWNELRAQKQTAGEKWNHGLKKAAITTGGAIVENTVGIIAGIDEMLSGGQYHNNEIGKMVDGWNEWGRKEMPNYYTRAEQDMGLWGRMGTANFWADKAANGLGYTLGSLATVWMTGGYGAIGIAGRVLQASRVLNAATKAERIHKLYKTAKGTKRGEQLLSMYDKVNKTGRIKKGLLTLEAGAMMSLAESSVEARETQKNIKRRLMDEALEKYPEGIPGHVLNEIEALSQAAGNASFAANMSILSITNVGMFGKFLAGGVTKQSLKGGITGGGLQQTGKQIVDKGSASKLGRLRKWTSGARRGMTVEAIQEGGQYATNVASTEYYASRFDNDGGITSTEAITEGLSRTFGETEGLESMMIGAIVGGIGGSVGTYSRVKNRNKLASRVQEIMNDDAFMGIINRGQSSSATSYYLDKADKYRAEGKDKLADQAMTQALINEISTLDNAGTLEFFTTRLNDFRSLSDTEFKNLFGIAQDIQIDKNKVIDNMLEETETIVRRKNALDEMFSEEATKGLPRVLMGKTRREREANRIKENQMLKAQLLHNAVFLDTISNQKEDKAKEIDSLVPGVTLSTLEEQVDLATEQFDALVEEYILNAQATGKTDENGNVITTMAQIPKEDLNELHNKAYKTFTDGVANSVKNVKFEHPLDKEAIQKQMSEYYFLHRNLQDLMENWNRLQTNRGRTNYIRAALAAGEQSIKNAANRRADEIINTESDPQSALRNIPSAVSKAKRKEVEAEVKKMQKQEIAIQDKYGDPNVSVELIDKEIEKTIKELDEIRDNPKQAKYLRHKLNVLEALKAVKLNPKNNTKKETPIEEDEKSGKHRSFRKIKGIPPVTSKEERLKLLEDVLQDKHKEVLQLYRDKNRSEKEIERFIYSKAKETGKGNELLADFLMEDILNNPQEHSEAILVNAMQRWIWGTGPINTGNSERVTAELMPEIKEEIEEGIPLRKSDYDSKLLGSLSFQAPYRAGRDNAKGSRRYAYEKLIELGVIEGDVVLNTEETVEGETQTDKTDFSTEEVIIKEEISPEEEQRLKEELNDDMKKDIDNSTAEVDVLPIEGVDEYYQQLLEEEERLRQELNKEDDNCNT